MTKYPHLIADIEAAKAIDAIPTPAGKIGVSSGRHIVEAAKRGAWLAAAKRARGAELNEATTQDFEAAMAVLDTMSTDNLRALALEIVSA